MGMGFVGLGFSVDGLRVFVWCFPGLRRLGI